MKKEQFKRLVKECVVEVLNEPRIQRKKEFLSRIDEKIKRIKEIGKKEFEI